MDPELDYARIIKLIEEQGEIFGTIKKRVDDHEEHIKKAMRPRGFNGSLEELQGDPARKAALIDYWRRGENGLRPESKAGLAVGNDPSGGYFVEPDTTGRLVTRIDEISPIRAIATVEQTGSTDGYEGIYDLNNPESGGWVGESQSRDETDVGDIGKYRIPLCEQFAMPKATQKILDDMSFDVENWLIKRMVKKFARVEGTAFVSGDSPLSPRGILTYPTATDDDEDRPWGTLQYLPSGASGAFHATVPGDALWDLSLSVKAEYLPKARWVMRRSTLAAVSKLKDGDGNYLLSNGNIAGAARMLLLGYPITLAEDFPAITADSFSIAFGDFESGYMIVDHAKGPSVLRDPFTAKGSVKFYAIRRVGGAVVDFDAIKLLKFAAS